MTSSVDDMTTMSPGSKYCRLELGLPVAAGHLAGGLLLRPGRLRVRVIDRWSLGDGRQVILPGSALPAIGKGKHSN